ncbi:hypothetical protein KKD52_04615 [Myxococcota bacterium]|nr:hypothetical protein [Myxococcota bacterium]MBU1411252.1 hypothetical protein [Myxococcota bacterium]MBU1509627.1 hypothetical protein [Myxococcota bacterium]PKN27427.1 MAG: hypothetical protein CVU65_02390 [Deltaproteobacteria bacterium HGW-Deltaproteobacteria-22]
MPLLLLLLALLSGCDWFGGSGDDRRTPEKTIRFSDNSAYLTLVKEQMTKVHGSWDRYLTASGNLVRDRTRLSVYAFLRQGVSNQEMKSVLVLGKTDLVPGEEPVVAMKELNGTVHELHLVRLGSAFEHQLLFTTTGRFTSGFQVITSVYWDVSRNPKGTWSFREVWKVAHVYDPSVPESYAPPDFHYWDVDDDGVQEIIVTNPWKGSPPPWKYRWAVFQWHKTSRALVPLRGLALFPFREQEPDWLVWSVLEMQRMQQTGELVRYFATAPACDSSPAMLQALAYFSGQPEGVPVIVARDERTCLLQANLVHKDQRMRLQFELIADISPLLTRWRICRIQLFRITR